MTNPVIVRRVTELGRFAGKWGIKTENAEDIAELYQDILKTVIVDARTPTPAEVAELISEIKGIPVELIFNR